MPTKSADQQRLMQAAAHTPGGFGGVPQSVGKEFVGDETKSDDTGKQKTGQSAGILFSTKAGQILLLRRGDGGDFPRTWGLPGGHQEGDESLEDCARRETLEETGHSYTGPLKALHTDGAFTTFAAELIDSEFEVKLCDESTGYNWSPIDSLPEPLHPGMNRTLRVMQAKDELDYARLIQDGVVPSGFKFANMWLFDIRIAGTGLAYRSKRKIKDADGKEIEVDEEFVWREPEEWCNYHFEDRCGGLAVLRNHPKNGGIILDGKDFKAGTIGAVMFGYTKYVTEDVQGMPEVWGIAKIYDKKTAAEMLAGECSTSPGVHMGDNSNVVLTTEGKLAIESQPLLLDHIAIVTPERGTLGVWDKDGEAHGVRADDANPTKGRETMTPDELKTILTGAVAEAVSPISKTIETLQQKVDQMGGEMEESKKKADEMADAKKKADEMSVEEEKMDSEMRADAQMKCDEAYSAMGERADKPMIGEKPIAYATRLLKGLQAYTKSYKSIKIDEAAPNMVAMNAIMPAILAEVMAFAKSDDRFAGQPLQFQTTMESGRTVTRPVGGTPREHLMNIGAITPLVCRGTIVQPTAMRMQ